MKTISDKDFNRIEDLISGKLSEEEEHQFRKKLKTEPELAKAYRFRLKIAQFWNEAETYITTKKQIKALFNNNVRKRKGFPRVYYIAASVTILIGLAVLYLNRSSQLSRKDLFLISENDSSSENQYTLESDEQPQKGTLYSIPPEYTIHDTLIIQRSKEMHGSGNLYIRSISKAEIIEEYHFTRDMDSLGIPLNQFMPGDYRWEYSGTSLSGNFTIRAENGK